ncbi:MAG: hypothetical protein PHS41_10850 [Victivallaceae bacterium]|nr:hypothetical protein [Victivallaceae bacterium]
MAITSSGPEKTIDDVSPVFSESAAVRNGKSGENRASKLTEITIPGKREIDTDINAHKFHVLIHDWIEWAKKDNLTVEEVDLQKFITELEQDPSALVSCDEKVSVYSAYPSAERRKGGNLSRTQGASLDS